MAEEQTADWPRFTLMTYTAPTGIPHGWDAELLDIGAPNGLICTAARELTLLDHPDAGPLVYFGTTAPDEYVCLDPRTKHIVLVVYGVFSPDDPQPEFLGTALVVNSSLRQFIASVRVVTERFPFDSEVTGKASRGEEDKEARGDRRVNEWSQAVFELAKTLECIDPTASILSGEFWGDFLADVGMGNYASEYWLRPSDR